MIAGQGDDTVFGGDGTDDLYGDDGDDVISGDEGHDRLYGGDGNDVFIFADGDGHDTIFDFDIGGEWQDIIQIESTEYGSFYEVISDAIQVGDDAGSISKSGKHHA